MENWYEVLLVFLLSTFKYVFGGVPLALGFGFSFFETVTVTVLGGIVGCTFFVYLSEGILKRVKPKAQKASIKKSFTRKNKIIVKVKRGFGLPGIALLTPFILSIPLGCFLAVRYFKNKHRILVFMYLSVLFWSLLIAGYKLFI